MEAYSNKQQSETDQSHTTCKRLPHTVLYCEVTSAIKPNSAAEGKCSHLQPLQRINSHFLRKETDQSEFNLSLN